MECFSFCMWYHIIYYCVRNGDDEVLWGQNQGIFDTILMIRCLLFSNISLALTNIILPPQRCEISFLRSFWGDNWVNMMCWVHPSDLTPRTPGVLFSLEFSVASPGYKKYRHIGTCSFGPAVSSRDTVGRDKLQTARMVRLEVSYQHLQ